MIVNQPKKLRTGDIIIKNLEIQEDKLKFDRFYIMVAYVRKSGVSRIQRSLEQFRHNGGKIKAVIGIDDKNTSKEGLQLLMNNVDEIYIYHNMRPFQTFHPKLYIFEKESKRALILAGSSNLTQGGLFTNYEFSIIVELNLEDQDQKAQFDDIINVFNQYTDLSSLCCELLDISLLEELEKRNLIIPEQMQNIRTVSEYEKEKETKPIPLFGTETIPPAPEPYPKIVAGKYIVKNKGFWKKLSAFDVSPTSAPGQIIIPMKYMVYFPPITNWGTTSVGARQAYVFFDAVFVDSANKKHQVKNVRAIHYVPAPHHPRPNQELRFTFRNQNIFGQLHEGDILEFRRTNSDSIWFEIKLIPSKSKKGRAYLRTNKRYYTIG